MLSGLTSLFDKNFVIGYLLPALVGAVGLALALPRTLILSDLLAATDDETVGKLFYVLLVVWVVAVGLVMTNDVQQRILSGYYWPLNRWPLMWDGQRRAHSRQSQRASDLAALGDNITEVEDDEYVRLQQGLASGFPPRAELRSTRFGNVVRAFEYYPFTAYGVDPILAWPRLRSVVPKDFGAAIEELAAQVNCLVNLVFILVLVGALTFGAGVHAGWADIYGTLNGPRPFKLDTDYRLLLGLAELIAAPFAYRWATERAIVWGHQVKAAFDCFLPDLIKRLGYALPSTTARRLALWADLNVLFVYHQPVPADAWPLAAPPPVKAED